MVFLFRKRLRKKIATELDSLYFIITILIDRITVSCRSAARSKSTYLTLIVQRARLLDHFFFLASLVVPMSLLPTGASTVLQTCGK